MATINRLSAKQVPSLPPGLHSDGGNLYLSVRPAGSRQWVMRYRTDGRQRELGLGGAGRGGMSLSEARSAAERIRRELRAGNDPLDSKAAAVKVAKVPTFKLAMEDYIVRATPSWKNAKSAAQWRSSLETHSWHLLAKRVDEITIDDMIKVLDPIWYELPETAKRVRGRVEKILSACKTQGHRTGENPAAWRDNLANIYRPKPKLVRGHFHSMPYEDVPLFVGALRSQDFLSALALEWIIVTVSRATVAVTSSWREINLVRRTWTIPASRMKGTLEASVADEDHVVPLTPRALAILDRVAGLRLTGDPDELLFPSIGGKSLSLTSLDHCRERMKVKTTTHGFRASFRTWAAQQTFHENDIAEKVLAHLIGDEVSRAYQRGNLLEKRRALMEDWAAFIDGRLTPEGNPFVRQGPVMSVVLDELQRRKAG